MKQPFSLPEHASGRSSAQSQQFLDAFLIPFTQQNRSQKETGTDVQRSGGGVRRRLLQRFQDSFCLFVLLVDEQGGPVRQL